VSEIGLAPVRDPRPLAVQVYDQLFDAFAGAERAGREVPTEIELAKTLGVSRTTVRQALALLEEDGVLQRGKGRRRFIAPPGSTEERNPPIERMLLSDRPLEVRRDRLDVLPATRWGSSLLRVPHETELLVATGSVRVDGRAVAETLELVPSDIGDAASSIRDRTLLDELGLTFRSRVTATYSRISAHSRAQADDTEIASGIVLTRVLEDAGRPVYLCKVVVDIEQVSVALRA